MKKQMMTTLIAAGIAAVLGSTPAAAQSAAHQATIPFSFEAGGRTLPEGTYWIQPVGGAMKGFKLTNLTTLRSTFVATPIQTGQPASEKAKLVFSQAGDHAQLNEIWLAGATGLKTMQSGKSKEASARVVVDVK